MSFVKRRILAAGATARVSEDSLHVPGQLVTIIGVGGEFALAARKVRTARGDVYDLPLEFLEPTEAAIEGAISRAVSRKSGGIETK